MIWMCEKYLHHKHIQSFHSQSKQIFWLKHYFMSLFLFGFFLSFIHNSHPHFIGAVGIFDADRARFSGFFFLPLFLSISSVLGMVFLATHWCIFEIVSMKEGSHISNQWHFINSNGTRELYNCRGAIWPMQLTIFIACRSFFFLFLFTRYVFIAVIYSIFDGCCFLTRYSSVRSEISYVNEIFACCN